MSGVGIALVLLGSLGQNLGNNLMVLGHEQHRQIVQEKKDNEEKAKGEIYDIVEEDKSSEKVGDVEKQKSPAVNANFPDTLSKKTEEASKETIKGEKERNPTVWVPGAILFLLSSLSTFAAFNFAPASLVASLQSVQFVSHLVFTKTVHNLPVTTKMKLGTAGIVGGCILTVLFSEKSTEVLNSSQVFTLYSETPFLVYLVFFFVFFVIFESIYRFYWAANSKGNKLRNHDLVEPLSYCIATALVGAFAVVHAKCLAGLLQVTTTTNRNEFERYEMYVILGAWLMFVVFWLTRLDLCFKLYPPWAVPVVHCCFIFASIVAGGIFFKEFDDYSTAQIGGFSVGVVLIVGGVYGIAPTGGKGHRGAVVPVEDGGQKDTPEDDLDASRPSNDVVAKPGGPSEKDVAFLPGSPGDDRDRADELDAMMAPSSSSKRKIVKHSISDIQHSL